MPFSARSLDFLVENSLNDSKAWFNEHKEEYKKYITEPFAEVVNGLAETMRDIDGKLVCDPRRISRLYRDARYSKGKSIFRDYVWYTFCRPREDRYVQLGFYFSISPDGFDYGCGFYHADSGITEEYRKLILDGDKAFEKALKAYKAQEVFKLYGDIYKRVKYPEASPEKQEWLNRKAIGVSCTSKDFGLLFGDRLIPTLAGDFKSIAPVYELFLLAEEKARSRTE